MFAAFVAGASCIAITSLGSVVAAARFISAQHQDASAPSPYAAGSQPAITSSDIQTVLPAAEALWPGVNFSNVTFQLSSLSSVSGNTLAVTSGSSITIDPTAEGWGWFVDPTNADFTQDPNGPDLIAVADSPAAGHMDLLTVVAHELGHVAGYSDIDPSVSAHDLMTLTLNAGERRLSTTEAPPATATSGTGSCNAANST
ncbi:MAG TPA: hypothetical protein VEJ44_07610, partial [Acidimicrobiales bacterium]|nr:hypothetical protein [Acidimicrobiales bacterium]